MCLGAPGTEESTTQTALQRNPTRHPRWRQCVLLGAPLGHGVAVEGHGCHPDAHSLVIRGRRKHEGVGGVPADAVHRPRVALQLRQQVPAVPVPDVHPAVLQQSQNLSNTTDSLEDIPTQGFSEDVVGFQLTLVIIQEWPCGCASRALLSLCQMCTQQSCKYNPELSTRAQPLLMFQVCSPIVLENIPFLSNTARQLGKRCPMPPWHRQICHACMRTGTIHDEVGGL